MIVLLLVLLVVVVLAVLAARRWLVRSTDVTRPAREEVVAQVRRGVPYAYQYVLGGPGGRDEGDHDTDKLVVRADQMRGLIVVRVAPTDAGGRRTGRSRLLQITR